jgi:hypothetical protein
MWLILQMSVMIAVLCANIYYQLTPNGVLAGLLAIGAAWLVTKALVALMLAARYIFGPKFGPKLRQTARH